MPRFAAVENGIVVGVLAGSQPPTMNVPPGRIYVDVTEHPAIQGGESYDGELFAPAVSTLAARVSQLEVDVQAVAVKSGVIITSGVGLASGK